MTLTVESVSRLIDVLVPLNQRLLFVNANAPLDRHHGETHAFWTHRLSPYFEYRPSSEVKPRAVWNELVATGQMNKNHVSALTSLMGSFYMRTGYIHFAEAREACDAACRAAFMLKESHDNMARQAALLAAGKDTYPRFS